MLAVIAIIIVFVVFIEVQYVLFKIYGFCIVSTDRGIGLFHRISVFYMQL